MVTNARTGRAVDTSDEWIVERTGIRYRHIAGEGETTGTLATEAARRALEAAGIEAEQIDLIVLATATPDQTFPATATMVQDALGCNGIAAFDVAAVCSGFLYALGVADSMLRTGMAKTRAGDRRRNFQPHPRLGRPRDLRAVRRRRRRGGASRPRRSPRTDRACSRPGSTPTARTMRCSMSMAAPSTTGTVGKVRMKGREVFRHAVVNLAEVLEEVLERGGNSAHPRSTGSCRIRPTPGSSTRPPGSSACRRKRWSSRSTTTPTLRPPRFRSRFDVAVRDGRIKPGDLVMLEAMGGGFTWGASLLRM